MTLSFRTPFAIGLGIVIVATTAFAASHSETAGKNAVAARNAQMKMVSYNTGIMGDIAKGDAEFDAAMVNSAATNLNMLAKFDLASLWLEGTEQGAVEGSRAKPDIWSDNAGFVEKFANLEKASAAMMGAADLDAVKANMGAIGESCKGCHETYRGPEN